jgi:D-alanyl-lipoteichoic acid acyltransferase DltB (MBOAT superfamily)
MQFNSFQYLWFLPAVAALYYLLPLRLRQVLLLAASYYFYMCWRVEYALLIVLSTAVDYWAGLKIGAAVQQGDKRKYLMVSLAVNLGLLTTFKYLGFIFDTLNAALRTGGFTVHLPVPEIILPVGISFYTFQTLSYTLDVYNGQRRPESDWIVFANYVVFFPQLVAGPIERSTRLLPQFKQRLAWHSQGVADGLRWILWGLFLKVTIADRLAIYVDHIYDHPHGQPGVALLMATYFFAFQIYCDFAGYSAIAIGSARVLGFDLMKNFNAPYVADSVADFWRRWHISLSTWFRDYFYFPMGGSRVPPRRHYLNLMAVFMVSGLWHGANWTFVVWGCLHGLYVVISRATRPWRDRIQHVLGVDRFPALLKVVRIVVTFHLVCLAWVFFRAPTLADAWYVLGRIAHPAYSTAALTGPFSKFEFAMAVALVLGLGLSEWWPNAGQRLLDTARRRTALRWGLDFAMILLVFLCGIYQYSPFIYFQF